MKIDYQSKKWEEEIERFKKYKTGDLLISEKIYIKKFEEEKDYIYFYFFLNISYDCI